MLDLYLCIKGHCWFQKLIKVYVSLEKLWINDKLHLGLSLWAEFNFSKPSLDRFWGLFFFWNIQCQLWPKKLEFNQHWRLLKQGNRAGSWNQLFHFIPQSIICLALFRSFENRWTVKEVRRICVLSWRFMVEKIFLLFRLETF